MNCDNDCFKLLFRLMESRPVTEDVPAVNRASGIIRDFLETRGLKCHEEMISGRRTLYCSNCGSRKPALLLCSHVDVVPVASEEQFKPSFRDGLLFGRGSCDCLGNVVTIIRVLLEAPGNTSVGCIFTTDEETGGSTTAEMVARGYGASRMVILMDAAGGIFYAQKGILSVKLTFHGRGGHSSEPWKHDNPILKMAAYLNKIRQIWPDPAGEEDWRISCAPTMAEAGNAHNRIPGEASVVVNFRTVTEDDAENIRRTLAAEDGVSMEILQYCAPFNTSLDAPELKLLQEIYARRTGRDATPVRMAGATDARHFAGLHIPIFMMGVDGSGAHSGHECLKPDSVEQMSGILCEVAERLASGTQD